MNQKKSLTAWGLVILLVISSCKFNNPVDPAADNYQGYHTVDSITDFELTEIDTDDYFIPDFMTSDVKGATSYGIEIYKADGDEPPGDGDTPYYANYQSENNVFSIPETVFLHSGTWWWRARVTMDGSTWSAWTAFSQFILRGYENIIPASGTVGNDPSPALSWTAITGADHYEIRYAETLDDLLNDSGTATLVASSLAGYDWSTALLVGIPRYWSVRHVTSDGRKGFWSMPRAITYQIIENYDLLNGTNDDKLKMVPGWDIVFTGTPESGENDLEYAESMSGRSGVVHFTANAGFASADSVALSQGVTIPSDVKTLLVSVSWTWYGISPLCQRNSVVNVYIGNTLCAQIDAVTAVEKIIAVPVPLSFKGTSTDIRIERPASGSGNVMVHIDKVWFEARSYADLEITNLTPLNGRAFTDTTPTIQWDTVAGADYYEVQYGIDGWGLEFASSGETSTNSYTIPDVLAFQTGYTYRVRAMDASGNYGVWSPTKYFEVQSSDFSDSVMGINFIPVKNTGAAASFTMGTTAGDPAEAPPHTVTISAGRNYALSSTEITELQYEQVLFWRPESIGDAYPVVNISWYQVAEFCNALSIKEGLTPSYNLDDWSCNYSANGYRLPTEAEWEYAAKGGALLENYVYSGSSSLNSVSWNPDNANGDLHPVGGLAANGIGLFDMSGNAKEWTNDFWYRVYTSSTVTDPVQIAWNESHVVRGGGFNSSSTDHRVTARSQAITGAFLDNIGFRILKPLY